MKKLLIFGIMAILSLTQLTLSISEANAASKKGKQCSAKMKVWTPPNITKKKVSVNQVHLLNNKQYHYVGIGNGGRQIPGIQGVTISCTCTKGTGCTPAQGGKNMGCVFGDCTACNGTVSGIVGREPGQYETASMRSGGFIKNKIDVRFTTMSEATKQPYVFPGMTTLPKVSKALQRFILKHKGKGRPVRALVSIAGRTIVLQVDKAMAERSHAIVLRAKGTCACTAGTCTYEKVFGVGEYCQADDCTGTCSLSTGIKLDSGKLLKYQMPQF